MYCWLIGAAPLTDIPTTSIATMMSAVVIAAAGITTVMSARVGTLGRRTSRIVIPMGITAATTIAVILTIATNVIITWIVVIIYIDSARY